MVNTEFERIAGRREIVGLRAEDIDGGERFSAHRDGAPEPGGTELFEETVGGRTYVSLRFPLNGALARGPEAAGGDRGPAGRHGHRPEQPDLRDHRDRGAGELRAGTGVRRPAARARLRLRARRLRRRLRSFYYLKHLPFDYLEIDGEFVANCARNATDRLVIQAVVDIARGMGKKTIAEFVTDEGTQHVVERLGVDHAQGDFVGAPGSLAALGQPAPSN